MRVICMEENVFGTEYYGNKEELKKNDPWHEEVEIEGFKVSSASDSVLKFNGFSLRVQFFLSWVEKTECLECDGETNQA